MADQISSHRVLARKYRPASFDDLIGQEALVQVLTNGLKADRLPHAFIFTGVRGVGKTTTARILARALNCIGENGQGNATPSPCSVCEPCRAIMEDRCIDVIEMDAASRTGVDDIREIIEAVRYKAVSARYKIYIIDEVHMLSKSAFNALLKTLEEPPAHVKFIFATTEIRRVPETVLSRCMRFDLRRIGYEALKNHLKMIAGREETTVDLEALALIARTADGSVRDSLSLLDQAMTLSPGHITGESIREMLGLAERNSLLILFQSLIKGHITEALTLFQKLYQAGADPLTLLNDLLDLTHWFTLLKSSASPQEFPGLSTDHQENAKSLATSLSIPILTRFWQVLLKGLQEISIAPFAPQALEMIFIRLAYLKEVPTPEEIITLLETPSEEKPPAAEFFSSMPQSFKEVVALTHQKREAILEAHLTQDVHLIQYEPGRIDLALSPQAPKGLIFRLKEALEKWTGKPWIINLKEDLSKASASLKQQEAEKRAEVLAEVSENPLVQATLAAFPGATIETIEENPLQEKSA